MPSYTCKAGHVYCHESKSNTHSKPALISSYRVESTNVTENLSDTVGLRLSSFPSALMGTACACCLRRNDKRRGAEFLLESVCLYVPIKAKCATITSGGGRAWAPRLPRHISIHVRREECPIWATIHKTHSRPNYNLSPCVNYRLLMAESQLEDHVLRQLPEPSTSLTVKHKNGTRS